MLTVKVRRYSHDKSIDGKSIYKEIILPATKVCTDYYTTEDGEQINYCTVENIAGVHSFDLTEGTVIFVENLDRKTVQVYKYSQDLT